MNYKVKTVTYTFNNKDELSLQMEKYPIVGFIFKPSSMSIKITIHYLEQGFCGRRDFIDKNEILRNIEQYVHDNFVVYENIPLDIWLDTKMNWIKAKTSILSGRFNLERDEVQQTIYEVICDLYKRNIYINNLNYVYKSCFNKLLSNENKRKRVLGSFDLFSLDETVGLEDNEKISCHELYGENDTIEEDLEFKQLKNEIIMTLRLTFSEREIEQILNSGESKICQLPSTIYRRLLDWRKSHKRSEYE